jgi:hypothetical protein
MRVPPDNYGDILKIVQIGFYAIGAIVAVLTYRAARRGLLNSVNTEYQKRVMDRLQKLSWDLYSEFDPSSPAYWVNGHFVAVEDAVKHINDVFTAGKSTILKHGDFPYPCGTPVAEDEERLSRLLNPIRSDPFIPEPIREAVIDLLNTRLEVLMETRHTELERYAKSLANGKREPASEAGGIQNRILEQQRLRGCGIEAIEEEVHAVRALIQDYFDGFNPHRRWWEGKRRRRPKAKPSTFGVF